MADKLVVIRTFSSYIEAELAKQTLEDNDIKAIITGENAANIYSIPAIAEAELQVAESQAEDALKILEDMEKQSEEQ